MGVVDTHGMGSNLLLQVAPQSLFYPSTGVAGYDAIVAPTAAQSAMIKKFVATPHQRRDPRNDKRATRSLIERRYGEKTYDWEVESWINPRGTDVASDIDDLDLSCFGARAIAGSVSRTFTPLDGWVWPAANLMTILATDASRVYSELLMTSWCEERTITATQGDEPTVSYKGGAVRLIRTGCSLTTSATTSATVPITAGTTYLYKPGSLVDIGSNTDLQVTAVSAAGNTITVDSSITFGSGDVVRPALTWDRTQTGGSPITGVEMRLDLGTDTNIFATAFTYTYKNTFSNIMPLGSIEVRDINPGAIVVSGELTCWARKTDILKLVRTFETNESNVNPLQLTVTIGTFGAANKLTVDFPLAEFDVSAIEVPDAEESTFKLPFVAKSGAAGALEVSEVWT